MDFSLARNAIRVGRLLLWIVVVSRMAPSFAEESDMRFYSIPEGEAQVTLKAVARQSEVDLVLLRSVTEGVRTVAIEGHFNVREAFECLLKGTPLSVVYHAKSGAYTVARREAQSSASGVKIQNTQTEVNPEMTELKSLIRKLLRAATAASLAGGAAASSAQEEDEGDVYELSPFVVDESGQRGYVMTSSLAGTRTKTRLIDIGSSISVLTAALLEDAGASDINDVMAILPNSEGQDTYSYGGENVNGWFASAESGVNMAGANAGSLRESGLDRTRGLGRVDLARDFFTTKIPFDSYNVESVTMNRGPNSILFGLGSPAGILNYTLKRARIDGDFAEVSLKVGNEHTHRETIDVNRTFLHNRESGTGLAVRVAGVNEDGGVRWSPGTQNKDRRLYGAFQYRPFRLTEISASYEDFSQRLTLQDNRMPKDGITAWVAAGAPTWDPSEGGGYQEITANPGLGAYEGGDYNMIYANASEYEAGRPSMFLPKKALFNASEGDYDYVLARGVMTHEKDSLKTRAGGISPELASIVGRTHLDPGNLTKIDGSAFNVALRQTLLNKRDWWIGSHSIDAQLSYNDESVYKDVQNSFHEGARLFIDVNEKIPGPDGWVDNPNFLRPGLSFYSRFFSDVELLTSTYNAELTYQLEPQTEWFNKLTVTGLYRESEEKTSAVYIKGVFPQPAPGPLQASAHFHGGGYTAWGDGQAGSVLYLGPPVDRDNVFGTLRFDRTPNSRPRTDTNVSTIYYAEPVSDSEGNIVTPGQWRNYMEPYSTVNSPILFGNIRGSEVESEAVVFHAMGLKDRLSVIYGLRTDTVKNRANKGFFRADSGASPGLDPKTYEWGDWTEPQSGDTTTFSAAAHPLGADSWLTVHYATGENFVGTGLRTDVWGHKVGPQSGEGTDYGFSVRLFENKLNLKLNWYETDQVNITDTTAYNAFAQNATGLERDIYAHLIALGRQSEWISPEEMFADRIGPFGWAGVHPQGEPASAAPTFAALTSQVSEGREFEMIYNVTPNWRVMANVARQEAAQGAIAPEIQRYHDERLAYFKTLSVWETRNPYALSGTDLTNKEHFERWFTYWLDVATVNEGLPAAQLSEWNANLVTNYDFTEGRLNGLSVGAVAYWVDKNAIGYGVKTDSQGNVVFDPSQPKYGPDRFDADIYFRYDTKIREIDTTFALRFENVFHGNELRPIAINEDDTINNYAYYPPSFVSLTATFRY